MSAAILLYFDYFQLSAMGSIANAYHARWTVQAEQEGVALLSKDWRVRTINNADHVTLCYPVRLQARSWSWLTGTRHPAAQRSR